MDRVKAAIARPRCSVRADIRAGATDELAVRRRWVGTWWASRSGGGHERRERALVVVLERVLGAQRGLVAADRRDGERAPAGAVRDRAVVLRGVARDVDPVPPLGVTHVPDA